MGIISMNRQPPNYRQTTANDVNRQTANRLYVKAVLAVVVVGE